jgi:hypothetical protein
MPRANRERELRMNLKRRDFLLLVTLVAATATPAFAQTVAPAVGPHAIEQSAASIPDFSGIWGHPYLTGGFEPPLSGPGPVRNRARRRDGVSSDYQLVGDYTNPILRPQAAEEVKKHGEISLTGVAYGTPNNQCWPEPVPYIFRDFGMQMLQQLHQITILYSQDHEVRRVRLNQPHPAQVTPFWYGDSVGHYEGDTLVVDTVGIKTDRPFAMIDMYGTPYTRALHVVERYRLLDYEGAKEAQERAGKENVRIPGWEPAPNYKGKGLQLQFTVEDEGVFTMSWSATVTYLRASVEWPEVVCAENTRSNYAGHDTAVPTADRPDF